MRLWSIHPKYLDHKGLVALWREALLAQKVLQNTTRGYKHHPQLIRFKNTDDPLAAIGSYLEEIFKESLKRGYHFNPSKINQRRTKSKIEVKKGQIEYEFEHLNSKLKNRDIQWYDRNKTVQSPEPHPILKIISGDIESWEITDRSKDKS